MALLQNVIARGTHAARPAAGSQGVIYVESDTGRIFRDSGSAWVALDVVTTAGDLVYFDGTNLARLGIGSSSQVLTVSGGVPAWAAASSGAMTLLASTTLGSTAATIDFSTISGSYNHLRLVFMVRLSESTTDDYVELRLNNDSGANYVYEQIAATGTTNSGTGFNAQARFIIGDVVASTGVANHVGTGIVDLPFYAGTTFDKNVHSRVYSQYAATTGGNLVYHVDGTWNSTAAITEVTLLLTTSTFAVGSAAYLYGIT